MHSVAVCALMLTLARQLGLDEDQARLAGLGGLMHDLGKAFTPPEILNKPGKLTDSEFAVMKQHPLVGARILQQSGAEIEVQGIALHHHEKVNGQGYAILSAALKTTQPIDLHTEDRAWHMPCSSQTGKLYFSKY